MKLIISALFIATIHVFAQDPPGARLEDKPELLSITAMMPESPATLSTGEKFIAKIRYTNPTTNSVRIFARPYTNGKTTPGYGAHPSGAYPKGTGNVEGWFVFSSATSVDEIQVKMTDAKTGEVIATTKLPVQLTWKQPSSATPATPATPSGSTSAADINNAGFLAVGSSYNLQFGEGGRLARFDPRHPVKITAAAPGGWYRVEYFAMPEHFRPVPQPNEAPTKAPPSEKKERWLNFAYVVSAVEATPTPEAKPQ
jgi:hypothetical protein